MSDTTIMRTMKRVQLEQYLRLNGKDPEDDAFADIFEGMEDEVEEDEWDTLEGQLREKGVEIDIEKVIQVDPSATIPGPTMAGPTIPGETIAGQTLVGIGSVPATEPDDDESSRVTVLREPSPNFGETNQTPQPVPQEPEGERKKSLRWQAVLLLAVFAGLAVVIGYKLYSNRAESAQAPQPTATTVVQTDKSVPSPTQPKTVTPAPPKEKPAPPTPKQPVTTPAPTVVATCNVTRYGLRDCTFQENCTRFNTGSLYLEATCGKTQYRSQESERVLPLGEGRKVTLVKSGT